MALAPAGLMINSLFLVMAFVLATVLLHDGIRHSKNYGDAVVQTYYKFRILTEMVLLIFLALLAAVFNAVIG